jgi:hypothetical protein
MPRIQPKNTWVLVVSGVLALLLVVGVVALDRVAAPINGIIRGAALFGYVCVFLTSLASNYMVELTRYFGRPFVKTHHVVSVAALVALATHAVSVAWRAGTPAVFVPSVRSLYSFFSLGGRPAFWLLAITSLTALFRTSIGKSWKQIHWLNYIVFFLATAHAQLIGANFTHLSVRIVSILMAVGLVVVFVLKRRTEYQRRQRRRSR